MGVWGGYRIACLRLCACIWHDLAPPGPGAGLPFNTLHRQVIRNGEVVHLPWRSVRTGDMIVVFDKEEFPADVILLATSEEMGKCYTEVSCLSPRVAAQSVDSRVWGCWKDKEATDGGSSLGALALSVCVPPARTLTHTP